MDNRTIYLTAVTQPALVVGIQGRTQTAGLTWIAGAVQPTTAATTAAAYLLGDRFVDSKQQSVEVGIAEKSGAGDGDGLGGADLVHRSRRAKFAANKHRHPVVIN